jgi:hypothetical protein
LELLLLIHGRGTSLPLKNQKIDEELPSLNLKIIYLMNLYTTPLKMKEKEIASLSYHHWKAVKVLPD